MQGATIELDTPPIRRREKAYPALVPGTPEWMENAKHRIGASQVPALFKHEVGQDSYHSAYDVWLEMTGRKTYDARDPDSPSEIGRELEAPISRIYARTCREYVKWIQPAWTEHDAELPILSATPDFDCGLSFDEDRTHCAQVKNRGGLPKGWGERGSDVVPRPVLVQVHSELTVTQLPFHEVVALLGGNRLGVYRIHREPEIGATIRNVVSEWHQRHIVEGIEPAIDGPGAAKYFGEKFGAALDKTIVPLEKPEEIEALSAAFAAYAERKRAERAYEIAKAECMKIIGAAYGAEAPRIGKALWYNQPGKRTITEAKLREALADLPGMTPTNLEQFILRVVKVGEPGRTFTLYEA